MLCSSSNLALDLLICCFEIATPCPSEGSMSPKVSSPRSLSRQSRFAFMYSTDISYMNPELASHVWLSLISPCVLRIQCSSQMVLQLLMTLDRSTKTRLSELSDLCLAGQRSLLEIILVAWSYEFWRAQCIYVFPTVFEANKIPIFSPNWIITRGQYVSLLEEFCSMI